MVEGQMEEGQVKYTHLTMSISLFIFSLMIPNYHTKYPQLRMHDNYKTIYLPYQPGPQNGCLSLTKINATF